MRKPKKKPFELEAGVSAGAGASDEPRHLPAADFSGLTFRKPVPNNIFFSRWRKLFHKDWESRLSGKSGDLLVRELFRLSQEEVSVIDTQVIQVMMEGLLALGDYLLATFCPWSSLNVIQGWYWIFALNKAEEAFSRSLMRSGDDVALHRVKFFHGEVGKIMALFLGVDFRACEVLHYLASSVFHRIDDIAQAFNMGSLFFFDKVTMQLLLYDCSRSESFEKSIPNTSWHSFLLKGFAEDPNFCRAIVLLPADDIFRLYLDKRVWDWLFDSEKKKFDFTKAAFFVEKIGRCFSVLASKLVGFKSIQAGIIFLLYQKEFVQRYFWRWLMAEAASLNELGSLQHASLLANLAVMAANKTHGLAFIDLLFSRMSEIYHQLDPRTKNYFDRVAGKMFLNCCATAEHSARKLKSHEVAWILRWQHLVAERAKLLNEMPFWLAMWHSSKRYGYSFFALLVFHPVSCQMFPEDRYPRERNLSFLGSGALRSVDSGLQKPPLSLAGKIKKIKAAINLLLLLAKNKCEERIILTIMLSFRGRLLITKKIEELLSRVKPAPSVFSEIYPFQSGGDWPMISIKWFSPDMKVRREMIIRKDFTEMLSEFVTIGWLQAGSLYYFAIERLLIEVGEVAAKPQVDTLPAASVSGP